MLKKLWTLLLRMPSHAIVAGGWGPLFKTAVAIIKRDGARGFIAKLNRLLGSPTLPRKIVFSNKGYCPTCAQNVTFTASDHWFRDHYICSNCGSKPRERALIHALEMYFPDWKSKTLHESSPINRGASIRLARECARYIPSQLFPDMAPGSTKNGVRCENLEALTFPDESIDIHITQDVFEHVFDPANAFREIARTLRPGGAHVFTVPLVNKHNPSKRRARMNQDGQVVHLEPPMYHGNPVSQDGALVTIDWGYDICRHIHEACGLFTHVVRIDDLSRGIRAEYIEVVVTVKPSHQDSSSGSLA